MKKIISLVLSLALILCITILPGNVTASSEYDYILGDADGNGKVELVDASYVQRNNANMEVPVSDEELFHGDIDDNGSLGIADATFIQRYVARISTPYHIGEKVKNNAPYFIVNKGFASAGETFSVAVKVKNNPGILGMTLTLSYNNRAMTLTGATSGAAVSDVLAFTKPGRFTNPCNFTWDGIELDDSQIKDGELLVLTFDVAKSAASGTYPITISFEEDSIFDKNLKPVDFEIVNGSVTVGNAVTEPTTAPEPTQPAQPATEEPVTGPAFVVEKTTASAGETVTVTVNLRENPGILGMTLTAAYDSKVLTLKDAASGSAVNGALTFTKPGKYTNPCNFTWDGIELNADQIKDGELLILTFDVASNAAKGVYPISLSYEEDSIISADLVPIEVGIVNGNVTVK